MPFEKIPHFHQTPTTLLKSITMFCGIDNIPQNIPRIFPTFSLNVGKVWDYFMEYC